MHFTGNSDRFQGLKQNFVEIQATWFSAPSPAVILVNNDQQQVTNTHLSTLIH